MNFLIRAFKLFWKHVSFWHLKRIITFLCVDFGLMFFVCREKSDAIIVVKFDLFGDYIIGRNFLRVLRDYAPYRSRKIVLCANQNLQEFIEKYDSDIFDDFIWVDRKRLLDEFWYRFETLRKLKRVGAQLAFEPIYFRDPYMADCLIWATGAPDRIGQEGFQNPNPKPFEPARYYLQLEALFFTKLVPTDHSIVFEFYRNQSFFTHIIPGVSLPQNTLFTPIPVNIPEIKGVFAVLLPGASEDFREWPPEYFAEVARHLFLNRGLRSVLLGSKADYPKALAIQQCAPEVSMDNLCGQLSLSQVVYLMSKCAIGITNESGGIHVLAGLNKLGVSVSNCNSFGLFHPYPTQISDKVSFVYPPAFYAMNLSFKERKELLGRRHRYFSMTEILPEAVITRADALLQGIPHNDPIQAMCDAEAVSV